MLELLANETVVAAIVGAVAGAGASYVLSVVTERRKQTRDMRRAVIAEIASLGHNYLATLQELRAEKMETSSSAPLPSWLAQLTRLDGNLIAIQTCLWHVYPHRRVRAAMARFMSRCQTVTKYVYDKDQSAQDAEVAIIWLASGLEKLTRQAATAARLHLRDRVRLVWVGFRVVTPEDRRLLSFEDQPPPWNFAVCFDFFQEPEADVLEKTRASIVRKAAHLRCKNHHRAAHVLLTGRSIRNFDIQVEACCSEFAAIVAKALDLNTSRATRLKGHEATESFEGT